MDENREMSLQELKLIRCNKMLIKWYNDTAYHAYTCNYTSEYD